MGGQIWGMLPLAIFRVPGFLLRGKWMEATWRVDTRHILGPKSHVSTATLVTLLLATAMEIWDRECGPFRPILPSFAILGQFGNTINPWGSRFSQKKWVILVEYHQTSMALELCICSSHLAGVMQLSVRATLPNFPFLAVFWTVV